MICRPEIAAEGLLISESMFGSEPKARDFPRRNRLVTGLSLGVVVVEAAQRSGSLISARCALEQGREVMAVPGSPLDPRTRGSNGLIRSGALLVETAEDVLDALRGMTTSRFRSESSPLLFDTSGDAEPQDDHLDEIKSLLSYTPVAMADLIKLSDLPVAHCTAAIVDLELSGIAVSLPGGLVRLRTDRD